MGHNIDLSELQQVVGKYVTEYNLLVAAGPLAGATAFRMVAGKSKVVNMTVAGAGAWFAIKELSGPMLGLITDQFGYLQNLFGR